jgi:hypothetical protein
MFLMWGYQGEQLSDIEATVQHVKKTDPDIFFTTVAYPIKGTPYFSDVDGKVEGSKPWHLGSDREFRIRGRHSRRYYSFADQLLRGEVELDRLRRKSAADASTITALERKIADARAGLHATTSEMEA